MESDQPLYSVISIFATGFGVRPLTVSGDLYPPLGGSPHLLGPPDEHVARRTFDPPGSGFLPLTAA